METFTHVKAKPDPDTGGVQVWITALLAAATYS